MCGARNKEFSGPPQPSLQEPHTHPLIVFLFECVRLSLCVNVCVFVPLCACFCVHVCVQASLYVYACVCDCVRAGVFVCGCVYVCVWGG